MTDNKSPNQASPTKHQSINASPKKTKTSNKKTTSPKTKTHNTSTPTNQKTAQSTNRPPKPPKTLKNLKITDISTVAESTKKSVNKTASPNPSPSNKDISTPKNNHSKTASQEHKAKTNPDPDHQHPVNKSQTIKATDPIKQTQEIEANESPIIKSEVSTSASKPISKHRSKTRNFFPIFSKIVAGVLGLSSIFLIATLAYLNILPTHYLIIISIIILAIAASCGFALWRQKTKFATRLPLNIIAAILSIIYLIGGSYITQASGFLDSLKPQEYISEQYYLIVKNNSKFQDVKSLEGKTVGTFDEGIEIYQEAIKELDKTVHVKLQTIDSIRSMTEDLMTGELDAIYLSAVHKSVIDEDMSNFSQNTRILHTIEVKVKLDASEQHPEIDVTAEPFTIYISGNDSYGGLIERGRSDVNMLVTVNPITHEILLTSIPRDYYVQLHGTTGAKDKLTHAGIYGVKMSVQTIEDLLDIKIDYYVKVNFSTLVDLVDTIGGIDVYSDQGFTPWTNKKLYIPEGNVHMDGAMALAFARERFSYESGDHHRVQNQRDVLNAIIKKVSSSSVILTRTNDILNNLSSSLDTNVGKDEISSLVKLQLQDMPTWHISEYSLNGTDSQAYTYSMGQQELYVMIPDTKTIQTAHDKITATLEDKSPADSVTND